MPVMLKRFWHFGSVDAVFSFDVAILAKVIHLDLVPVLFVGSFVNMDVDPWLNDLITD